MEQLDSSYRVLVFVVVVIVLGIPGESRMTWNTSGYIFDFFNQASIDQGPLITHLYSHAPRREDANCSTLVVNLGDRICRLQVRTITSTLMIGMRRLCAVDHNEAQLPRWT